MTKYFLTAILALLLFINTDCKKDILTPEEIKPGSRNYTWTVDTIYGPYNPFTSITGSSPTDLWTANPGDAEKIFYHYDGVKWTTDLIPRSFSPFSIISLGQNNVWSAGDLGSIWKYDGSKWKEQLRLALGTDSIRPVFDDMYGFSENDIYATGICFASDQTKWGIIYHYDGNSWKQIDIPKISTNFIKIRESNNGKLYLRGVTDEQFIESTYQLYEFDGTTLTQIKSGTQANDQFGSIVELDDKIYFIIGFDLFDYVNSNFIKLARLSDLSEFLNVGFGRSVKDVFLGMRNGIAHYNGTNTEYLIKTEENTFVRTGIIFAKDVFMMGRDQKGNNLIYHGKLNE
jgi:hypothetical protein